MSNTISANRTQVMLLPPSIDEFVGADDAVRFIADVVAEMDLAAMGFVEPSAGTEGRPHFDPRLLLAIWLYGYFRRVRSTRALEIACRERLPLLWLTAMKAPDHNTLWRFFNANRKALRGVFKTVLRVAAKMDLVGMVVQALDGTKVKAASSDRTALHRKTLEEQLKNIDALIDAAMKEIEEANQIEQGETTLPQRLADARTRKSEIQAKLRMLKDAGTDHLHPNEPDARTMKNDGKHTLSQNAQAVADESGIIVAEDVTNEAADNRQLTPMFEQAEENLGERADHQLADAGYESGAELARAEERGLDIIGAVKDSYFEKEPGEFDKARFTFDQERNAYICPRGGLLPVERLTRPEKDRDPVTVYRCGDHECPVREQCTDDPKGRTVRRSPHDDVMTRQRQKLADPEVKALYRRRKQIIELVFAVIKQIDGFRRFTVRGLEKVRTQWSLICTAYNLRKIYVAWRIQVA